MEPGPKQLSGVPVLSRKTELSLPLCAVHTVRTPLGKSMSWQRLHVTMTCRQLLSAADLLWEIKETDTFFFLPLSCPWSDVHVGPERIGMRLFLHSDKRKERQDLATGRTF